jgi:cytochrome c biogenesis protein CcmG/thiol:disulfide interchange protein DsbE
MSELLHQNKKEQHATGTASAANTYRLLRRLAFSSLLLGVAVISGACNGTDTTTNSNTPVISNAPKTALPMPPLNGKSITNMGWNLTDGKRNALADFNGKVLVLDFYATWCEPCRRSIPHLIDLQRRYENDVRVIGLNVGGPDDVAEVPGFAREFKIQYPLGLPDDELVTLLMANSDAIPQTFVFDRSGKLIKSFVGFGEATGGEIDRTVETALHQSAD